MTISGSLLGTALLSLYDNNGAPSEDIPGNSGPSASVVLKPGTLSKFKYAVGAFACADIIGGKAYFACRTIAKEGSSLAARLHLFETDGTTVQVTSIAMAELLQQLPTTGFEQNPLLFVPMTFYKGKLLLSTASILHSKATLTVPSGKWAIAVLDPVSKSLEKIAPFTGPGPVRWWIGGSSYDAWGFSPSGSYTSFGPGVAPFTFDRVQNKLVFSSSIGQSSFSGPPHLGTCWEYNRYGAASASRSKQYPTPNDWGRHIGAVVDLDLSTFAVTGATVTIANGATVVGGVAYSVPSVNINYQMTGVKGRTATLCDWYVIAGRNNMTPSSSPVTNDIDTDTSLLQGASYRRVGHDPDLMAITLPMYSTPGLSVSSPSGSLYDFVLVADTTDPSSVLPRPSTSFRAIRKQDADGKVTRYSMYPEQPDYATYKRFPVEVRAVTPDGYACFADTASMQASSAGKTDFAAALRNVLFSVTDDQRAVMLPVPARIKAGEWYADPSINTTPVTDTYALENRNIIHAFMPIAGKVAVLHANVCSTKDEDAWPATAISSIHLDVFDDPRT